MALAVISTKTRHPNMDPNAPVFGQIVSAAIGHLLDMTKITVLREIRGQIQELVESK